MTSLANINVRIRSVHFRTYCGTFSSLFQSEPDICMIVHTRIVISNISFAKSVISASYTKTKFHKSQQRKTAKLHPALCILPKTSTSIIDNDSILVVLT